jgi:trehalose 6-phosphate synthase
MILDHRRAVWTKNALHELLRAEFDGVRMITVSNREPYLHHWGPGGVECIQPAGGITAALDPIMRVTGGVWVAHGSGDADRTTADGRGHVAVPPGEPTYTLHRVWLDRKIEEPYYCGLANEGLWPLCHNAFHRPVFRLSDWESYREANRIFADAVIEEADGEAAFVFIQDYHFGLLPRLLKKHNPNLTVAQFWHIPWPNRETFRTFPWKEELLDGMLGNDLLGFHLPTFCRNFLETVERGLEAMVDAEQHAVWRGGHLTRVRPFPIGIDFEEHVREACGPEVQSQADKWRKELGNRHRFLGIGIDRVDYTKGIPERLWAVDRLLESYPEFRGKLLFLQVAVPSRMQIGEYQRLNQEIESAVREINCKWARGGWRPIRLCGRHLSQVEMMALHRLSDFCMVTSLHDGMNLVAKEYVASRTDDDGVLVLSSFTGAARELTSALLVNPFSVDDIANAVRRALTMCRDERRCRMQALRSVVRTNNIYTWAGEVLYGLLEVKRCARPFSEPEPLALVSGL